MAEREGVIEAADPEVWVYFGCNVVLEDELLILRSSVLTHNVFSLPSQWMKPGREGSRIGRTKSAEIHPSSAGAWAPNPAEFREGCSSSQDNASRLSGQSVADKIAKGTSLSHESILCTASEQAESCLQGCCSECMAAGGCSGACEPALPRQSCCLDWGRDSGLKAGKMTKNL